MLERFACARYTLAHERLVTPNLEMALRRIRQQAVNVVLWVDAVCEKCVSLKCVRGALTRRHRPSQQRRAFASGGSHEGIFQTAEEGYAHVSDGLDNSEPLHPQGLVLLENLLLATFPGDADISNICTSSLIRRKGGAVNNCI